MSDVISLTIPNDHLDFEIGGKTFTASFSDKSVAVFKATALEIEKHEVHIVQEVDRLATEATAKKDAARKKENGELKPDSVRLQKTLAAIDRDYNQRFVNAYEKADKKAGEQYKQYLDDLFGAGSGEQIYKICSESSNVLSKVVTQVVTNMTQATDLSDYRQRYANQIAAIKASETQVGE
ncbi:hypothetical protein [Furfurilactobacillus entadae]|uniref:hypothetical protein n=1 Tax=Furfurilactobacillus entadae TaxID=2922307 RepID=UPI0035E88DB8